MESTVSMLENNSWHSVDDVTVQLFTPFNSSDIQWQFPKNNSWVYTTNSSDNSHDDFEEDDPKIGRYPMAASGMFITVVGGGVLNFLLIYLAMRKSKLTTVINLLLISQCLMNLLESLLVYPWLSVLMWTGVAFPEREGMCRFLLSLCYCNWSGFCFSLLIIAIIRLLYVVAPLKMHKVNNSFLTSISCLLMIVNYLVWFLVSLLMKEKPFGIEFCMTPDDKPSNRIIASVIFTALCVIATLCCYICIIVNRKESITNSQKKKQRNIISAKTGMIQCIFLLSTYIYPITFRVLAYRGVLDPVTMSLVNICLIFFCQCVIYPLLTIICSTILRKELNHILQNVHLSISESCFITPSRIIPTVEFSKTNGLRFLRTDGSQPHATVNTNVSFFGLSESSNVVNTLSVSKLQNESIYEFK